MRISSILLRSVAHRWMGVRRAGAMSRVALCLAAAVSLAALLMAPTDGRRVDLKVNMGGGAVSGGFVSEIEAIDLTDTSFAKMRDHSGKLTGPYAEVLQTQRFSREEDLFLHFPVDDGVYTVTLLFAETWDGACESGKRVFDVFLGSKTFGVQKVLGNFDIFRNAKGCHVALKRSFPHIITKDGLTVVLRPIRQNPQIGGIIISGHSYSDTLMNSLPLAPALPNDRPDFSSMRAMLQVPPVDPALLYDPATNPKFNVKGAKLPPANGGGGGGGPPGGMLGGMAGGMPGGMAGGMPGGMAGGMPGGMAGGMPGGMAGGMPGGMAGGMPGGPPGHPGGMPGMGGGPPGAMAANSFAAGGGGGDYGGRAIAFGGGGGGAIGSGQGGFGGGAPQGAWGAAPGFGGGGGGGGSGGYGAFSPRRRLLTVEEQYAGSAPPAYAAAPAFAQQPAGVAPVAPQQNLWQQQQQAAAAAAAGVAQAPVTTSAVAPAAPGQWQASDLAPMPQVGAQPQTGMAASVGVGGTPAQGPAPGSYMQQAPAAPSPPSMTAPAPEAARIATPMGQTAPMTMGSGGVAVAQGAGGVGSVSPAGEATGGVQTQLEAKPHGVAPFAQVPPVQAAGTYTPAAAVAPGAAIPGMAAGVTRSSATSPSVDAQVQAQAYTQAQAQVLAGPLGTAATPGSYGVGVSSGDVGSSGSLAYGTAAGAAPLHTDGGAALGAAESVASPQSGGPTAYGDVPTAVAYGAQAAAPAGGASQLDMHGQAAPQQAAYPPSAAGGAGAVAAPLDVGMASRAASYNAVAESMAAVVPGLAGSDGMPVVRPLDPLVLAETSSAPYDVPPPAAATYDVAGGCMHNATHCSCAMQQASLPYSASGGDCLYVEDPTSYPMGCTRGACSGHYACTCDAPASVNRLLCGRRLATSILVPVDAARGPVGTTANGQSVVPCRRAALEGSGVLVLEPVSL